MLKYLTDFKNSIRYSVLERVSNPLFAAFTFSWLAFNWQTILILLFSDQDIEVKIGAIISVGGWWTSLILPSLSAVFYVTAMPHFVEYTYKFQSGPFKRSQDKLADRIDNALRRKATTEILRAEADIAYDRKTTDSEKDLEKLRLDINSLKSQNGEKEKEVNDLNERNEKFKLANEQLMLERQNLSNSIERLKELQNTHSKQLNETISDMKSLRTSTLNLVSNLDDILRLNNMSLNQENQEHRENALMLCKKYK